MNKTKLKSNDVMYESLCALCRHNIYWLTAESISWDLNVDEDRVAEELDTLVEWGLAEKLEYSITWYKITTDGITRLIEYKLQNGLS